MDLVKQAVDKHHQLKKLPKFDSGDTVGVYVKVKEGDKERIQLFKGVVLKIQGSGVGRSFTVRKISEGVGVERTFPFVAPIIDRVEVLSYGKTRRSRLFYLRDRKGRAAKVSSELAIMREMREGAKAKAKEEAAKAATKGGKKAVAQGTATQEEAAKDSAPKAEESTDKKS